MLSLYPLNLERDSSPLLGSPRRERDHTKIDLQRRHFNARVYGRTLYKGIEPFPPLAQIAVCTDLRISVVPFLCCTILPPLEDCSSAYKPCILLMMHLRWCLTRTMFVPAGLGHLFCTISTPILGI